MGVSIDIKGVDRLNNYNFYNHNDNSKISDYEITQIDTIRTFFNSIQGKHIDNIAIFNNRLVGINENIIKCNIKDSSNYNLNTIIQNNNSNHKISDFDYSKKDKLDKLMETIQGKVLSFRKKDSQTLSKPYNQNSFPILNTKNNIVILTSKELTHKFVNALFKYKDLYASNDNLTYGHYMESYSPKKSYGFINNTVGIIIIVLGIIFIIYKILSYIN